MFHFCAFLTEKKGHSSNETKSHQGLLIVQSCAVLVSHQQVAGLGQRDELLVPRRAHVEADRQHLLQRRHDQRRLDGVELTPPFLVPPLLILASRLEQRDRRHIDKRQRSQSTTAAKQFET